MPHLNSKAAIIDAMLPSMQGTTIKHSIMTAGSDFSKMGYSWTFRHWLF